MTEPVPVLIVGAGPAGLSAAILLARLGVGSLVVERHPSTTDHPKARGFSTRTMEILRPWNIDTRVRAKGLPSVARRFIWVESLAGREIGRVEPPLLDGPGALSPTFQCHAAQDEFEAQLRLHAETYRNIDLRFNTQLTSFEQTDGYVRATLQDRTSGKLSSIDTAFMIAADGASSRIRESLGVHMDGPGETDQNINIHFRAELAPWVEDRPALGFISSTGNGTLLWAHGTDRWLILRSFQKSKGEQPEDFTPERCLELARQAVGIPDLSVEIVNVAFWTRAALVAENFRRHRVFLVGDAAHRMPPTGGFGANTSIQDAHNLAWKLAGVINGWAGPGLLDTYSEERRPIAQSNAEFSLENGARWVVASRAIMSGDSSAIKEALAEQVKHLDSEGQALGFCYESGALIADGSPPPIHDSQTYRPCARPGARAPHLWLRTARTTSKSSTGREVNHEGAVISTLDLFEHDFTLLTGIGAETWSNAYQTAAKELGVPLNAYTIGPDSDFGDETGCFSALYGVQADGAVLVRPDGHVAWRSQGRLAASDANALSNLRTIVRR